MVVKVALSALLAFVLTAAVCPGFIARMKALQFGQQVREDGPARHFKKAGTPTMGGVVFLAAAALASLVIAGLNPRVYLILLVMLGCGLIGFLDDYLKIAGRRSLGLKARYKLFGGLIVAISFMLLLNLEGLYSSQVAVYFTEYVIDLGILYPLFLFLVVLSATNTVNLTDGLDGLAAGTAVIGLGAYLYIAGLAGELVDAVICGALIGALVGFLIYNRHPARLFMGDAGSFGLGGAFAALAIISKTELLLMIIGGVFVIEALSVIAQVASFQLTGRRVLLMSPLHHHFELKGWSEWRVVSTFWGAAVLFTLAGVLLYQR